MLHTHTPTHTYIHTHIHTHTHTKTHSHTLSHTHTHTHTLTHIYTHTECNGVNDWTAQGMYRSPGMFDEVFNPYDVNYNAYKTPTIY
jgi:hypothetical protein